MKIKKYISVLILGTVLLSSCDFLEENPQGILDEEQVKNPNQIEGLVTAAYASLGNDHYDIPFSLWPYGNVRSDDAYKGGNDQNDISTFHYYEISENIYTDFGEADRLWFAMYEAISRINSALSVLTTTSEDLFALKDTRMGEMYFLRGHFYFMLKVVFGHIPFIDEDTPLEKYAKVSNTLSNDEQWAFICNDFQKAYDLLPESQSQVGRANQMAAAAYLAKARLYKAFRQDERNNVTGTDEEDLREVLKYTQIVMNSSYRLEADFAFNFLPGGYQNGAESLFAVQYSEDDGTMFGRLNWGDVLSLPQKLGCCDFHKPSQNLVNAYRTREGLPQFDTYNNDNVDYLTESVDPRLFHTVALPGLPYKYNEGLIYEDNWTRNPEVYGTYASLKENVDPDCDCIKNISPFYGNAKNRIILRYADVLLMRAEAFIELHQPLEALDLINDVRERAKKSTTFLSYTNNADIALYTANGWTEDYAREALRWERRLEFAMEGQRFFDLVRWGVVTEVMNEYFNREAGRRSYLSAARFDRNQDEYIPIPQAQINFTEGIYKQNAGW